MNTITLKNGEQVEVFEEMPDGWKQLKGASTAPYGYIWIWNGKSLFHGEYRTAFLKRKGAENFFREQT